MATATATPAAEGGAARQFAFPPIHSFPPFYTRQPNQNTWASQAALWSQVIRGYCRHHRVFSLPLNEALDWELFDNKKIKRKLGLSAAQAVVDYMVQKGDAEWDSQQRLRCLVYWRKPSDWANLIYKWVGDTGNLNSILTVYELIHGDTAVAEEFHGLDPKIMTKALDVLAKSGKAQVFEGSSSEDVGVKFYP